MFNWILWDFDPVKLQVYNPASPSVKFCMTKSPSMEPIHIFSLAPAWILFSAWTPLVSNLATGDLRLAAGPRNHSLTDIVSPQMTVSLLKRGQLRVMTWPRIPVTTSGAHVEGIISWMHHIYKCATAWLFILSALLLPFLNGDFHWYWFVFH